MPRDECRRLGSALEIQLRQDRADVVLDRLVGQEDFGRDLLVGHALGDEREDLPFLGRQPSQLVILADRARRQLELTAGLDRQLLVAARERDHVTVLEHGRAAARGEPLKQSADAMRAVVRRRLAGVAHDADQLVLGADSPGFTRLARGREAIPLKQFDVCYREAFSRTLPSSQQHSRRLMAPAFPERR